MAEISIGNTTIINPLNLVHSAKKLEVYDRTIDGSMIINRNVNSEDQPIDKYNWELPGIIESEMFLIKEEAKKIGNLYLIDYHKIMEVLSGDGSTKTFTLQRLLSGDTPVPEVEVDDGELTVQVTADTDPLDGEVHINKDTGVMTFYTAPTDVDNNIVVKYEPKYSVHIMDYQHTFLKDTVASYTLICEEV